MPVKKSPASTAETINSLRTFNTQKEHMASMEQRLTFLIQWHEDLGDHVATIGTNMDSLTDRVGTLEKSFQQLSQQLETAANRSQSMLQDINNCLVGTDYRGVKRPGLCDDVKAIATEQARQGTLIQGNVDRLSSLERTRATIVWAAGGLSTVACTLGLWIWSHTSEILATVTNVYGKPKTELTSPHPMGDK